MDDNIHDVRINAMSGEIKSLKSKQEDQERKIMETDKEVSNIKRDIQHLENSVLSKFEVISDNISDIKKSGESFQNSIMGAFSKFLWTIAGVVIPAIVLFLMSGGLNVVR